MNRAGKKRILVVRGGRSNEREISFQSGANVENALKKLGHDVIGMNVDDELFRFLLKREIDLVFIALHGKWGEDGTLQGFLDMIGIPYTGSGVLACALAMDKLLSKQFFLQNALPTAQWEEVIDGQTPKKIAPPYVIKPVCGGSTVGVSIVRQPEEFTSAYQKAAHEDGRVFVESYIQGKELTVGVLGNRNPIALPVIDIRTPQGTFYDYQHKYTVGGSQHVIPAPIEPKLYAKAQELSVKAHRILGCRGFSRTDLMLSEKGELYVLEVNTIPGLTSFSLFPDAAKYAGMSFEAVIEKIVELSFER